MRGRFVMLLCWICICVTSMTTSQPATVCETCSDVSKRETCANPITFFETSPSSNQSETCIQGTQLEAAVQDKIKHKFHSLDIGLNNSFKGLKELEKEAQIANQSTESVQKMEIQLGDLINAFETFKNQHAENKCLSDPCQHDGECVSGFLDYACKCKEGYNGNNCEKKNFCVPNPCQNGTECFSGKTGHTCKRSEDYSKTHDCKTNDYISYPPSCDCIHKTNNVSGKYFISPDPLRILPFPVFCNFSENASETIIHHNSENEVQVDKCRHVRCYKLKIEYTNITMTQIEAVIQQSSQCRQFIKYRCIHSRLLRDDFSAWLSRNGTEMNYWGGASSKRGGFCACGETGTCVRKNWKCNCDANDDAERFDEGYLTDKNTLPVTELQFGDTDKDVENGWHTLGPLICTT